jgi:hypothetical protein
MLGGQAWIARAEIHIAGGEVILFVKHCRIRRRGQQHLCQKDDKQQGGSDQMGRFDGSHRARSYQSDKLKANAGGKVQP